MNEFDVAVHYRILEHFVEHGAPPDVATLARVLGASEDDVAASLVSQSQQRALNLFPGSTDIRMAHPMSAVPTPFRVCSGSGCWWGNCAWCALGIPAMLHRDATVFTVCGDCQRPITWRVEDGEIRGDDALTHIGIPARRWWEDVARTCATILAYHPEHIGQREGAVLQLDQLWRLAVLWYGDRYEPDWRRKTAEEAEATFAAAGLTGDFWRMK